MIVISVAAQEKLIQLLLIIFNRDAVTEGTFDTSFRIEDGKVILPENVVWLRN